MDKWIKEDALTYNGMSFSQEKNEHASICYNTDPEDILNEVSQTNTNTICYSLHVELNS